MAGIDAKEDEYVHPFLLIPNNGNGNGRAYYFLLPEKAHGEFYDWFERFDGRIISYPKFCPPDAEDYIYKEVIKL